MYYSSDDLLFIADDNHEFDLLIFTQQWPVTTCIEWMEFNKQHTCLLPSPKEIWTIHGVWPTRFGTIGPAFCNKTATFDPDQLTPFKDQLEQFWLNIENGTFVTDYFHKTIKLTHLYLLFVCAFTGQSLWQHEWLKHGTCAAVLPTLSSEQKYFGKGLNWLHSYSMSSILANAKILPDNAHKLHDIHEAVVSTLQKRPSIHCIHDRKRDQVFLSEIRICFDKQLELVDCDGVMFISDEGIRQSDAAEIISNCDPEKPILYPSVVPSDRLAERERKPVWQFPVVQLYRILDALKWLTL